MDSNAAVVMVMFAVFSPVASKIINYLVLLLLIARLDWADLGMHSVSFFIAPSNFSNSVAARL